MAKRIMMIGAHPDDCDFRGGGLALKYADLGYEVKFLAMCNGCYGHMTMRPAELAARRRQESLRVAALAGITYDVWEDMPDCELTASLESRKRLVRDIRAFAPELVICLRPNDYHADHRNSSLLVQDASYLLTVPHFCPEVKAMYRMPVIMYFPDRFQNPPFKADIAVSIDDVIERKFRLWDCHVSQVYEWLAYESGRIDTVPKDEAGRFEWLHTPKVPRDRVLDAETINKMRIGATGECRDAYTASKYRSKLIERYGEKGKSVIFAEALSICEYGRQPDEEFLKEFFPF